MRETLRLMSLSRLNYTMSIYLIQIIFGVFDSLVVGLGLYGNKAVFPVDPYKDCFTLAAALIVYCIAQIPYAMALSTLFSDIKMANQIGGLLLVFP